MKNLIYLIIFSTIFTSCEKEVFIDIPDQDVKMVINSYNKSNQKIQISLTTSSPLFSKNNIQNIPGILFPNPAIIQLYENDVFIENLSYIGSGRIDAPFYESNYETKEGKTYTLKAIVPSLDTVSTFDKFPKKTKINSIKVEGDFTKVNSSNIGSELYKNKFKINISDDLNEDNFYGLQVSVHADSSVPIDSFYSNIDEDLRRYNDENSSGIINTQNGVEVFENNLSYLLIFSDELFNGKNHDFLLEMTSNTNFENKDIYPLGYNVQVKLISLSKSIYMHLLTTEKQQKSQDDPFSEPVLLYTNVKNGYGAFGGYSVDEKIIKK